MAVALIKEPPAFRPGHAGGSPTHLSAFTGDAMDLCYASQVKPVHLSYRIASTGCGTVRNDAVDFCEIVCRQHNLRGPHILLEVLARLRARYRYDEGTRTRALGQWPSDGELGAANEMALLRAIKRSKTPTEPSPRPARSG